jgi:transposase
MASRKYLDKEFKMNAVRLMNEGQPVAKIARDLEVSANSLYRWKNELQEDAGNAFRGSGNLKLDEKEQRELQKGIRDLEMENEILKKQCTTLQKTGSEI